jgi:hypothetical protein
MRACEVKKMRFLVIEQGYLNCPDRTARGYNCPALFT